MEMIEFVIPRLTRDPLKSVNIRGLRVILNQVQDAMTNRRKVLFNNNNTKK
jgi:hypothetical protein